MNNMESSCDEMVENLKIIIKNSLDILKNLTDIIEDIKWESIKNKVFDISTMDTNKYPSYTKKTLFKFYDIKELLKK